MIKDITPKQSQTITIDIALRNGTLITNKNIPPKCISDGFIAYWDTDTEIIAIPISDVLFYKLILN